MRKKIRKKLYNDFTLIWIPLEEMSAISPTYSVLLGMFSFKKSKAKK